MASRAGADDALERLVAQVRAGARYREVAPELVRAIGARELAHGRAPREAMKATRNKLHQVAGVYREGDEPYPRWLEELRAAMDVGGPDAGGRGKRAGEAPGPAVEATGRPAVEASGEPAVGATEPAVETAPRGLPATKSAYADWDGAASGDAAGPDAPLRAVCARLMRAHASTRERLPILDEFYGRTLAGVGPLRRVLDLACGLNPLALPWMPLADGAEYLACDIFADMVGFLDAFLGLAAGSGRLRVRGHAEVRDVLQAPPEGEADLALLLKALPCLEQIDRAAVPRLLRALRARHLLVSFPVRGLGGRARGMPANYEAGIRALVADTGWSIRRFEFATELAFLVTT